MRALCTEAKRGKVGKISTRVAGIWVAVPYKGSKKRADTQDNNLVHLPFSFTYSERGNDKDW